MQVVSYVVLLCVMVRATALIVATMCGSIFTMLLMTILAISLVYNNPTHSAVQSLFMIFAPCRTLLPSCCKQGRGGGEALSQEGPC